METFSGKIKQNVGFFRRGDLKKSRIKLLFNIEKSHSEIFSKVK